MTDELAREQARAAHMRLDGINGQIVRLRDEQQRTRTELSGELAETREGIYQAVGKVWDAHAQTAQQLAEMKGSVGMALKVGGAIGLAMLALLGSVLGVVLTRPIEQPHQAAPRNATFRVEKPTDDEGVAERLATRHRGSHERIDGP